MYSLNGWSSSILRCLWDLPVLDLARAVTLVVDYFTGDTIGAVFFAFSVLFSSASSYIAALAFSNSILSSLVRFLLLPLPLSGFLMLGFGFSLELSLSGNFYIAPFY